MSFNRERFERRRGTFEDAGYATCPCCGYPTIVERAAFEICSLCAWEDDGQDDPGHRLDGMPAIAPDVIAHGPNHDYSLTEARANFAENLASYRPTDIDFEGERAATPIRREIIAAYERAISGLTDVERAVDDARYLLARLHGI